MTLLAVALGCVLLLVLLGVGLRRVTAAQRAATLRKRLADDSGVAMIEFVLVTPVLLFVTLLLLQTSLVFTGLFYVQYSAFAAARSAIVQIPTISTEPSNYLMPVRGSDKFDAITSSAMIAVLPVCGSENGALVSASEIVAGVHGVYSAQGKSSPAWVNNMLANRLFYAMNHTEVVLEKVLPGNDSDSVRFEEVTGLTQFSPKEAIGVRVRHEFALTVPLASKVFTLAGESGSYTPASRDSESPGPPGQWTLIESRAVLTNEGIDRKLPPAPSVPRY